MTVARPQIVSWVIDGALALSLLAAVLQGGQFIERLDTVVSNIEKLSGRVTSLESHGPGTNAIHGVLEAQSQAQAASIREIKSDITARLDRIENKLDRLK